MLVSEGNITQCQAEVTFDREVEGCLAPLLKWRERTGRGWRGSAQIEFQQDSIPKKIQDRQHEAAGERKIIDVY